MRSEETRPVGAQQPISRLLEDGAPPHTNLSFGWRHNGSSLSLFPPLHQVMSGNSLPSSSVYWARTLSRLHFLRALHSCATGRASYVKASSLSPNLSIAGMLRLALRQIHRPLSDCRCLQNKVSPFACGSYQQSRQVQNGMALSARRVMFLAQLRSAHTC